MADVDGSSGGGVLERKRKYWRGHVEGWACSGVSGAAYCRRHGLRPKSLYYWRRVFSGQEEAGGQVSPECSLFAEVCVDGGTWRAAESGVEVVLGGRRRVCLSRGFDAETLACVVRTLEDLAAGDGGC